MTRPTTHQRDLAKLPRALAPLLERPQWAVWRWTQKPDGKWQKPPFQARDPQRHASVTDSSTWNDYPAALAAVRAGHADGISYVLTADDPFAAVDLDHCRDPDTRSIDIWAQLFLERGRDSYSEVTPSGEGVRIWGLTSGAALNRKFTLEIDGKKVAAELFRRANKALTITGYTLDPAIREFTNIDRTLDWAVVWGQRRRAAATPTASISKSHVSGGNGCGYSIDQIEQFVRAGAPAGENRSDVFHTIVGHYTGCGWPILQTFEHLVQFRGGIGEKYIGEGRLSLEVSRSFRKWAQLPPLAGNELAQWTSEWMNGSEAAEAAEWSARTETVDPELQDDPELEDDPEPHEEPAGIDDDFEFHDEPAGVDSRSELPNEPPAAQPQKPSTEEPQPASNGGPREDAGLDNDDLDDDDLDDGLDEEPKEVGMSAANLCATVFEPPNEVVPGYVIEGLTLFAGKPKIGKSWLMLHVGIAVARGSFTLDDIHCVKGDVLYAALEDNKRRLQRRLRKLLDGQPAPERLRILSAGEMPRLSEGGTALIRAWIEQVPEPKLVVIDVLAKVRDPRRKDQGPYDSDYAAMEELKKIADEYGIAIVVIHHLRKMDADDPLDQVSGTTGLSGSVDTVLVLSRTSSGTLHGRGRDLEDIEKAVQFDRGTCTWTVLGGAASVRYSGERAAVLAALQEATEPISPTDVAAITNMKIGNVRKLLAKLVRDGLAVRVGRGRYALAPSEPPS